MQIEVNGRVIKAIQCDITELAVDSIVNAANAQLILGGGVAGAIRAKGGPSIQEECNRLGPTTVGQAVMTRAGKLRAQYVIHAVGPRLGEGDEDNKLRQATLNSLRRATEAGLLSIAFPAISTGIFGFPKDRCADIMIRAVLGYLKEKDTSLREIIFCLWSKADLDIFSQALMTQQPDS